MKDLHRLPSTQTSHLHQLIDVLLDELEVSIVASDADNCLVIDLEHSINVLESGHVSVRNEIISCNNYATLVLHAND